MIYCQCCGHDASSAPVVCDACFSKSQGALIVGSAQREFIAWAREQGATEVKTGEIVVKFGPPPPQPFIPMPSSPPPIIDGFEKMNEQEREAALKEAERERLMFRSS
jgi:hypothetical protein